MRYINQIYDIKCGPNWDGILYDVEISYEEGNSERKWLEDKCIPKKELSKEEWSRMIEDLKIHPALKTHKDALEECQSREGKWCCTLMNFDINHGTLHNYSVNFPNYCFNGQPVEEFATDILKNYNVSKSSSKQVSWNEVTSHLYVYNMRICV